MKLKINFEPVGTRLVTDTAMIRKITYKEFSIALGILVAIIIVMVIWLHPLGGQAGGTPNRPFANPVPPAGKVLIQKIISSFQDSFR